MGFPPSPEDMEKIQTFIEYVSENPLILNRLEFHFLKHFIEHFGGSVPECDGKAELCPEIHTTWPTDSDEFAVNFQLMEPNVLYIDEKPPKVIKSKTTKKPTARKNAKFKSNEAKISTNTFAIKLEGDMQPQIMQHSTDDPLYTPDENVKSECPQHKESLVTCSILHEKTDKSNMLAENSFTDEDEPQKSESDASNVEGINSEEDDEPLITIAGRRGRPRKHPVKDHAKIKQPRKVKCREICKQHCNHKFTETQRRRMCDYFWSLAKAEREEFIRKHIKAKRYTRLKRKKPASRGQNCCYYLDEDIGKDTTPVRVCRKYFEATLCITSHMVKKTLLDYEPEPEIEIKPLSEAEKEERKRHICQKLKEIRQTLDPATGDLVTVESQMKHSTENKEDVGKKKRARRKPGDPQPEHFPKPIKCEQRCIYKCHIKFDEEERKQICDLFWSLDYKRRKDFILARIQTKDVETQVTPEFRKSNRPPRAYHTRFFLRSGINGENKRVCKHFLMSTLCINRNFITNAIEFADKNTGYYTGVDRRGRNTAPNKIDSVRKQMIKDHINSYPTWVPHKKSKTKYLHHNLSIKQMYVDYKQMCMEQQKKYVSTNYYYKSFHEDFRLSFLCPREPKRGGGFLNLNPNISHYTGDEPGGYWMDANGEKLNASHMPDAAKYRLRFPNLNQKQLAFVGPEEATQPCNHITAASPLTAGEGKVAAAFNGNHPLNYTQFIAPSSLTLLTNNNSICAQGTRQEFDTSFFEGNAQSALLRRL